MIAPSYTELPGGFRLPAGSAALRMEKLVDRALLALVVSYTPGYQTPSGIPKVKTAKQRQMDRVELDVLLRLMVNDFGIQAAEGYTEPALQWRLCELAVERGLMTHHPSEAPVFRLITERGSWCLWDVMSDERKDREQPGRRTSHRHTAPRY
jgi:hypothetical protein